MSLLDRWNKNKFSIYKSEEKTVLKLMQVISDWMDKIITKVDEVDTLANDNKNNKVSYTELHNKYKLSEIANFTGSWWGIDKPVHVEGGIDAVVLEHGERLDEIAVSVRNFGIVGDGSDETLKLQVAVNTVKPYTRLIFEKGKTYHINSIEITQPLTLDLTGATIITNVNSTGKPLFWFRGSVTNNLTINGATSGDYGVTVNGTLTGIAEGDIILVKDSTPVPKWSSGTAYIGRQELHVVDSVSGSIINTIDPIEYDYNVNPSIWKCSMLEKCRVIGGLIKEVDPLAPWVDPSNGFVPNLIQFDYCIFPYVEGVRFEGWQLEAISFRNCIQGISYMNEGIKPFRTQFGGHGYLNRFLSCKGGLVYKNKGYKIRHLVDLVQSYDVTSAWNYSEGCVYGAYTTHGMGSKRYHSLNDIAIGDSGWGIGNPSFAGDYNVIIENPTYIGKGQGISIQCKAKNVFVNNPMIFTPNRGISITTGAENIFINGGIIDLKYNTTKLESILIRPFLNIGDTGDLSQNVKNVYINGTLFNGRTIIYADLTGVLEITNCKFECSDGTSRVIQWGGATERVVLKDLKIYGTFERGLSSYVAPSDGVRIENVTTKYHTGTPIYIMAQDDLVIKDCRFLGTSIITFNGDINTAIQNGAIIKGNIPSSMNAENIGEILWQDSDVSDNFNPKGSSVIRLAVTTEKVLNSVLPNPQKELIIYSANNNPIILHSNATNGFVLKDGVSYKLQANNCVQFKYFNNKWYEVGRN